MLHLPQKTKLLMVLAFLRLCQGLPGTGRESQVNSASGKNLISKEDRHLQSLPPWVKHVQISGGRQFHFSPTSKQSKN